MARGTLIYIRLIKSVFLLKGLQFMHQCHVAHRYVHRNIITTPSHLFQRLHEPDPKPTFPNMFHPMSPHATRDSKGFAKHYTRTARPTKYYLIDFGLSRKYNSKDGPIREEVILGGDTTVPEFQNHHYEPQDPFPTDIYYIGNMIREDFLPVCSFALICAYLIFA